MNIPNNLAVVDRRTIGILHAASAVSRAFADLSGEIAVTCADGILTDTERQRLAELMVRMDSVVFSLKQVVA